VAGEIADHFDMTKPSISHHLATLKQAGLVLDERRGQNIVYSLNTTVFQDVLTWLMHVKEREAGERRKSDSARGGGAGATTEKKRGRA
jgi:DNA-binding transcriptional ArsR family regulator